jgi:branched-chain amino acid transport system permease protein/neutral amino acid transport system permease protein
LYLAQLFLNGIMAGSVYALFAVGLSLVYGVFRFINFAHGELIIWGAYGTLLFSAPPFGLPIFAAAIPAFFLTAAIGLLSHRFVYRPLATGDRVTLLIASIGLSYFLRSAVKLFFGSDIQTFDLPLTGGIFFAGLYVTRIQLLTVACAALFFTVLYLLFTKTLLGKALRAIADNGELAFIMGLPRRRVALTVWTLSAVFAGAGGLLMALDTNLDPYMGLQNLIKAFAAVLLGGAGNVWGALFGGLAVGIFENMSVAVLTPGYKDFIAFAVIILMLLFRPHGIFSVFTGVR